MNSRPQPPLPKLVQITRRSRRERHDVRRQSGVKLGYSLSTEEHPAPDLVRFAQQAEAAGFDYASISDHFHPWVDAQGNSPFAWSVLGAIANATDDARRRDRRHLSDSPLPPGDRRPGRRDRGVADARPVLPRRRAPARALNEHILGRHWPPYETRASMLEEAVEVIRALWKGETVDHQGTHFTVDNARLYSLPDEPPPIIVAAAGPKAARLASRIGDGLINPSGDAAVVEAFAEAGDADRPRYLQVSVCWHEDEAEARRLAHRLVPSVALPGELGALLPTPTHYQQAVELVTEDDIAKVITCGPDPERHIDADPEGHRRRLRPHPRVPGRPRPGRVLPVLRAGDPARISLMAANPAPLSPVRSGAELDARYPRQLLLHEGYTYVLSAMDGTMGAAARGGPLRSRPPAAVVAPDLGRRSGAHRAGRGADPR